MHTQNKNLLSEFEQFRESHKKQSKPISTLRESSSSYSLLDTQHDSSSPPPSLSSSASFINTMTLNKPMNITGFSSAFPNNKARSLPNSPIKSSSNSLINNNSTTNMNTMIPQIELTEMIGRLYDKEKYTIEDNIVRRMIYQLSTQTTFQDISSVIVINFTNSHFQPGATKWSDLKDPYKDIFNKVMNILAFTIGNKRIDERKNLSTSTKKVKQNQPILKENTNNNNEKEDDNEKEDSEHDLESDLKNKKKTNNNNKSNKKKPLLNKPLPQQDNNEQLQQENEVSSQTRELEERATYLRELKDKHMNWYGRLNQSNLSDKVSVYIETLFDDQNSVKVNGFRLWILSKIYIPENVFDITMKQTHLQVEKQHIPLDIMSGRALLHSLEESDELIKVYNEQLDSLKKNVMRQSKSKATQLQLEGITIQQQYSYIRPFLNPLNLQNNNENGVLHSSALENNIVSNSVKHYYNLFKKYLVEDGYHRKPDEELNEREREEERVRDAFLGQDNSKIFYDKREIMQLKDEILKSYDFLPPDSYLQSFIKNMFTLPASMFYHVRKDNILSHQRDIFNYIHPKDRKIDTTLSSEDGIDTDNEQNVIKASTLESKDIALEEKNMKDCKFYQFYNPQTTYIIPNEYIMSEFLYYMPLPHHISCTLQSQASLQQLEENQRKKLNNNQKKTQYLLSSLPSYRVNIKTETREEILDKIDNSGMDMISYLNIHDKDGELQRILFPIRKNFYSSSSSSSSIIPTTNQSSKKALGLHHIQYIVTNEEIMKLPDKKKYNLPSSIQLNQIDHTVKNQYIYKVRQEIYKKIEETLRYHKNPYFSHHKSGNYWLLHHPINAQSLGIIPQAQNDQSSYSNLYVSKTDRFEIRINTHDVFLRGTQASMNDDDIDDIDNDNIKELGYDNDDDNEQGLSNNNNNNNNELKSGILGEIQNNKNKKSSTGFRVIVNKNLLHQFPYYKQHYLTEEERLTESFLANANLEVYSAQFQKYHRPLSNTLDDVIKHCEIRGDDEWLLKRSIFLRLNALNSVMRSNLDKDFIKEDGRIPEEKYHCYQQENYKVLCAKVIEVWHEFFNNIDVSIACEGIRSDLNKRTSTNPDRTKRVEHTLNSKISRLDVRPFHQFKIWVYSLFSDVSLLHYHYKIMYILYISNKHHCRWYVDCNNPKLNTLLYGEFQGGKSFMQHVVRRTCPTNVGDMVVNMTNNAFNIDRNLDDMAIIMEECPPKYLGLSGQAATPNADGSKTGGGGGGGGSSSNFQDSNEALAFFKNRLTSGITAVMAYFIDESTPGEKRRDMKISKSSCQGVYNIATNIPLAIADRHLVSRFICLSVPKSASADQQNQSWCEKGKKMRSTQLTENAIRSYEQHKDIHRLYFIVEMMIRSNVLIDQEYGVTIDGGKIYIEEILDRMKKDYNIGTKDMRKRNHVLEFARCECILSACYNALTNPILYHYQLDPKPNDQNEHQYLGINPRMIIHAVFPFLYITRDHVISAITALSSLWQHDNLSKILHYVVIQTKLQDPINAIYRRVKGDNIASVETFQTPDSLSSNKNSRKSSRKRKNHKDNNPFMPQQQLKFDNPPSSTPSLNNNDNVHVDDKTNNINKSTSSPSDWYNHGRGNPHVATKNDYNYVSISKTTWHEIYKQMAGSIGSSLQVAAAAIEKILKDMSEEQSQPLYSYQLFQDGDKGSPIINDSNIASPINVPSLPGDQNRIMRRGYLSVDFDDENEQPARRPLVVFQRDPVNNAPTISFLISYLKEKLPDILGDDIISPLTVEESIDDEDEDEEDQPKQQKDDNEEDSDDPQDIISTKIMSKKNNLSSSSSQTTPKTNSNNSNIQQKTSINENSIDSNGNCIYCNQNFSGVVDKEIISNHVTKCKHEKKQNPIEQQNTTSNSQALGLIDTLRDLGYVNTHKDSELYKSISTVMCNKTTEKNYLNEEEMKEIELYYQTDYSGNIPWFDYGTSDSPSSLKVIDAHPNLVYILRRNNDFGKEIPFHDVMKTLQLKRLPDSPSIKDWIICNYGKVSPSAKASLDIYDDLIPHRNVMKESDKRTMNQKSWVVREDLDFTICRKHLIYISYKPIDKDDHRFAAISYPQFWYQITTDHSHNILEDDKKHRIQQRIPYNEDDYYFREYPLVDLLNKVITIGEMIQESAISSDGSNKHQQNIPSFADDLLSDCNIMKEQHIASKRDVITCGYKSYNLESIKNLREKKKETFNEAFSQKFKVDAKQAQRKKNNAVVTKQQLKSQSNLALSSSKNEAVVKQVVQAQQLQQKEIKATEQAKTKTLSVSTNRRS